MHLFLSCLKEVQSEAFLVRLAKAHALFLVANREDSSGEIHGLCLSLTLKCLKGACLLTVVINSVEKDSNASSTSLIVVAHRMLLLARSLKKAPSSKFLRFLLLMIWKEVLLSCVSLMHTIGQWSLESRSNTPLALILLHLLEKNKID